jgi:hypothetical protein
MAFPSNFWEEFDKRIDKNLDERFDNFEKKLEKKFDVIDKKFKDLINWTKRQDKSIEDELTMSCFQHLQKVYPGYITTIPHKSVLGRILKNVKGITITDFDGAIILTNDHDYADFLNGKTTDLKFNKINKAFLIIIEAKQHLTSAKVKNKLEQRNRIIKNLSNFTQLQYVDNFIGFYAGGTDIDPDAELKIKEFLDLNKQNELIGILKLNGNRFSVQDIKNDYGNSYITFGGKKFQQ